MGVGMTLQILTPRCHAHRGGKLRGVPHTAESSFVVNIRPRSQAQWCASHLDVHHTSESSSAESNGIPRSQNKKIWETDLKGKT